MSNSNLVRRLRYRAMNARTPQTRIAFTEAADRIEALAERVARLEGALTQTAEWFEGYALGHKIKGDLDKAKRNGDRAKACRAALGEAS